MRITRRFQKLKIKIMKQIYIIYFFIAITTKLSFAQVINPTDATTTATNITGSLVGSYNQEGLISPTTNPTTNHSAATTSNSFACECQNPTFDFVLGGTYTIDGVIFWNAGSDNDIISSGDGIKSVKFYSSTDGTTFTEIVDAPTEFTENLVIDQNDQLTAQTSTFTGVSATHIRMEVLSNFNDSEYTSFSEIAFASNNILSTEQFELIKSIKVYPNPVSEFLKISELNKSEEYKIYDITGSEISNGNVSSEEKLNVKDFPKGLYFIKFDNRNTLKFLKE